MTHATSGGDPFAASRAKFEAVVEYLESAQAAGLEHFELEIWLEGNGREVLRTLLQEHYDLRATRETRLEGVADAQGVPRRSVEPGHTRLLTTIFGDVTIRRLAYRQKGSENLCPADGDLNLPKEQHSHSLRRLAAIEATRGSFEEAQGAISRATGQTLGKRQVEELTKRAAQDVDTFYASLPPEPTEPNDLLVLSADGKGIVMRPDALRPATRKAQAQATPKLATRLSRGEKRNRKRMAEIGAVYDATPVPRKAADILPPSTPESDAKTSEHKLAPTAKNKWLAASVVDHASTVIAQVFAEADRRDPEHERPWVALVDGNQHQIDCIETEAARRKVAVTIVIDFIHVLEYLWKAAWCFYREGDPRAEAWVREKALAVLEGRPGYVAAAIRRKATCLDLSHERRKGADTCASYLVSKKAYLDYPTALQSGWPIATGVIEGACRHLVKDRMDLTGARWSLEGAEAVLKLRTLRANGDFPAYWAYHRANERRRVHEEHYKEHRIPLKAA